MMNRLFKPSGSRNIRSQRGMYFIFTVIMAVALLMIAALAIDVGRMMIISRGLRTYAESAALAGVQRLRKCDITLSQSTPLNFDCSSYNGGSATGGVGGWQAVKPAIITVLDWIHIPGLKISSGPVLNQNGTRCDLTAGQDVDGFGALNYTDGIIGTTINFQVERMFECTDGVGIYHQYSLEQNSHFDSPRNLTLQNPPNTTPVSNYNTGAPNYHYCLANMVAVTLRASYKPILSQLMGASAHDITRTAYARVHRTTGTNAEICGFPSCTLMNQIGQLCFPEAC